MQEKESQEKDNHNLYSQRCPAHSAGRTLLTLAGTESNCKQRERERQRSKNTGHAKVKDHKKMEVCDFFTSEEKTTHHNTKISTDLHNILTDYENCILTDCLHCYDMHYFKYFWVLTFLLK